MAKYHVNPKTGNPGQCRAQHACPFGAAAEHYETPAQARAAYEQANATNAPPVSRAPSEVLRALGDLTGESAEALEARKAQIYSKPFSEQTDAETMEVVAIVSEQERRGREALATASVPCDDRHQARIAQQGYCPKCGSAT